MYGSMELMNSRKLSLSDVASTTNVSPTYLSTFLGGSRPTLSHQGYPTPAAILPAHVGTTTNVQMQAEPGIIEVQ